MIIRSQNKRVIETFDNAYVSQNSTTVFVNSYKFGEYSTEDKAIKVLDDIFIMAGKGDNTLFQMPNDNEVI